MKVLITGQSGTGKTTLAKHFEEMGFHRVSLDEVARGLDKSLHPHLQCLWPQFFHNGSLDRKALGGFLFDPSNQYALDFVNALYAPGIQDHLEQAFSTHSDIVVDSFQAPKGVHFDHHFHLVIDREIQLQRLQLREPQAPLGVLWSRLSHQDRIPFPQGAIVLQG